MNYEVAIINPRTNEERKILVELSIDQVQAAKTKACLQSFVQTIARPVIPAGFLPIGNGVRPLVLQ